MLGVGGVSEIHCETRKSKGSKVTILCLRRQKDRERYRGEERVRVTTHIRGVACQSICRERQSERERERERLRVSANQYKAPGGVAKLFCRGH